MSEQPRQVGWSGPAFETSAGSVFKREGAHYNIYGVRADEAMALLRSIFPNGEADDLNFCLFSTSGVHGSYSKIEEMEGPPDEDGYIPDEVTFLIVHPRLVCMRYGNVRPSGPEDIAFLKKLRASSWAAVQRIGKP